MKKFYLCLLTAAVLFCSVLFTAQADDSSGACGDDLFWELIGSDTLKISGTGEMYDYSSTSSPWYNSKDEIKNLILCSDITSISSGAFSGFTHLTDTEFSGTADDWRNLHIGSDNETLINSKISYIIADTSKPIVNYTPDGRITVKNSPYTCCKLILAQYDNSCLKKLNIYDLNGTGEVVSINTDEQLETDGSDMSAFLWSNDSEMTPLAAELNYTVETAATTENYTAPILKEDEHYSWLIEEISNDSEKNIKLFNMDNTVIEASLSEWVEYWGPDAYSPVIMSKDSAFRAISSVDEQNLFMKLKVYATPIRLVKYATDPNSGDITRIFFAIDASSVSSADALRISTMNLSGIYAVCGFADKYLIKDDIIEFNAPLTTNDEYLKNPDNCSFEKVDSVEYTSSSGCDANCVVGEFSNSITPTLLIKFNTPVETPGEFSLSNVGAGPDIAIAVTDFTESGENNKICTLKGQSSGDSWTYTTSTKSTIGIINDEVWSGKDFSLSMLWNYVDYDTSPADLIEKGDTLLHDDKYTTAKYISVSSLYDYVIKDKDYGIIGNRQSASTARVSYYFNALESINNAYKPYITLKDSDINFGIEEGTVFDLVNIDINTKELSFGTLSWDELIPFDQESKTGDYVFLSVKPGTVSRGVVYRFYNGSSLEQIPIEELHELNKLSDNEKYGWILGYNETDSTLKIFTQNNEVLEAAFAAEASYMSYESPSAEIISGAEAFSLIKQAVDSGSFCHVQINNQETPVRLVKYEIDNDGMITSLHCSQSSSVNNDSVYMQCTNLKYCSQRNGFINGYNIPDDITEFNVPVESANMSDSSNYNVGTVDASNYIDYNYGSTRCYIIGEFVNKIDATILINFNITNDCPASFSEMSNTGSGPSAMIVDNISEINYGNSIYKISGYDNGAYVSFKTNKSTNVGVFENEDIWSGMSYAPTSVWTAMENIDPLSDYISKGDLILYTDNGNIIARYASAKQDTYHSDDSISFAPATLGYSGQISTMRCFYRFIEIIDYDFESDTVVIYPENISTCIFADPSSRVDLVHIGKNGDISIESGLSVFELNTGDYLWVSYTNSMSKIGNLFAFRIEE